KMPMVMKSGMIGSMQETSTFDQNHLNLLFGAEKERTQVVVNLHSHHVFSGEDSETKGEFEVEEAYGTYRFSDLLTLKSGFFLTPFGIYNSIRYITPLFATVVLPQMYEMPANYNSEQLPEPLHANLMPQQSNFMLTGRYIGSFFDTEYSLFVTNGFRGESGRDENTDKGFGGRIRVIAVDRYKLGLSIFSGNDSLKDADTADDFGKVLKIGFDIEILLLDELWKMEYEFVRDDFENRAHRYSFYVRTTLNIGSFSPFASFDFAKDNDHALYKKGQARYSLGSGYSLSETVTLKAEYHFHVFNNADAAPVLSNGLDEIHMFRGAIIFAF
ncbi:MAG: hypothetical protein ACE5FU_03580, partial [Nitrospinota bacterium]